MKTSSFTMFSQNDCTVIKVVTSKANLLVKELCQLAIICSFIFECGCPRESLKSLQNLQGNFKLVTKGTEGTKHLLKNFSRSRHDVHSLKMGVTADTLKC